MWELSRPTFTVSEALSACLASKFKSGSDLKERLEQARSEIESASSILESSVVAGETYKLDRADFELTGVSNAEMSDLYGTRMARRRSPARYIYDEIMAAPEHGTCPFCGHRDVSTLDHYMPKAVFPALAIDPINLVPACRDCNFIKGVEVSIEPHKEPLHPYFDVIGSVQWLCAKILHFKPAVVKYYVHPPEEWPDNLAQRVKESFNRFNLDDLYGSHAAQELNSIRLYLENLYQYGAEFVREHLKQIATSKRAAKLNSWQTAMYQALAADEWFHDGNFRV